MKFGGTSVADPERIKAAASKVAAEVQRGHKVAVVVSAMAGVTDGLIALCNSISKHHDLREHDAVVATGEQVTAGLMAMALRQRGLNARSWQGWQVPLRTTSLYSKARIEGIEAEALLKQVMDGEIAVMAGFQGVAPDASITTLGRGGSDTSAVALAIGLRADRCDIYTDVDGVYTTDPRLVPKTRRVTRIAYEEMLEIAALGARVLQTRSVELAMRFKMPVQVLSSFGNAIGSDLPGTLVTDDASLMGENEMEQQIITGIAYTDNVGRVTVQVADRPGVAALVFGPLADANINVDMIAQTATKSGTTGGENASVTKITFSVGRGDLDTVRKVLESEHSSIGFTDLTTDADVVKISVVGMGMRSHVGVAATMFRTLAAEGINIEAIDTSEISTSVLIGDKYKELALRSLHTAYGLDRST